MNPKYINSANVLQFGFEAVFNLEARKLVFNIAGHSTFKTGGAAAVGGISFKVIDPSGVVILNPSWTPPHINPASATTYELSLPSAIALFGNYLVIGYLKEANGNIETVELPVKNICKPALWDDGVGAVPGSLVLRADCTLPRIRIAETTPLAYGGRTPVSTTKNGMLYYPQGTISPRSFTFTPFETNVVYTGPYTVRDKTIARYDMKDGVFVDVAYVSTLFKTVTCKSAVADLACCLDEINEEIKLHCNSNRGRLAQEKLDRATLPLLIAYSKERNGMDPSEDIERVRKILGCDCGCGPVMIEPQLVQGAGNGTSQSFLFEGACDTDVVQTVNGTTTKVVITKRNTVVDKANPEDTIITIQKSLDACNVYYKLLLDYTKLTQLIVTNIVNDSTLLQYLSTFLSVNNGNIDLTGLDGKCVMDLSVADYSLNKTEAVVNSYGIAGIVIDGVLRSAPAGLRFNAVDVSAWLNSINLGVFSVISPINGTQRTLSITSTGNTHNVMSLQVALLPGVQNPQGGPEETLHFTNTRKGIREILQGIFDNLCDLDTGEVLLGSDLDVCYVDSNGQTQTRSFKRKKSGDTLDAALVFIVSVLCYLVAKAQTAYTLTCDMVKKLFVSRPGTPFKDASDYFLGTKDGNCSQLSAAETADILLTKISNDATLLTRFCQIVTQCNGTGGGNTCAEVAGISASMVSVGLAISGVSWKVVPQANQTVSVFYRECPSGGVTPPWVSLSTTVIAQPDGSFTLPVLKFLSGIGRTKCYEVWVKNNACGEGTTKQISPAVSASIVSVVNGITNGTIQQVQVQDEVTMGSVINSGATIGMTITQYDGVASKVDVTLGGVQSGTILFYELNRQAVVVASGYFTYNGADTTIANPLTMQNGDALYIATADRHTNVSFYAGSDGAVTGICTAQNFFISRDTSAMNDAAQMNQVVSANYTITADNGCTKNLSVLFPPGVKEILVPSVDMACNGSLPCSSFTTRVTSISLP